MKLRVCLVVGLVAACGGKKDAPVGGTPVPVTRKAVADKDIPDGLDLRLSDGKQGAPAYDASKLTAARKLPDADVQQLLARAKPFETEASDQQAFALRPATEPPPRTGNTVAQTFPPPASSLLPPAATDVGGDLKVLRWMPEGEVPLAPELSITFSQPMVAVTSQSDAAATVPVKMSPQPKGRWRWLGTRTALFDPDVRFPQATTYRVSVPAGTKSATGGVLGKELAFTFTTPPVKLVRGWPDTEQTQGLDVPMFVEVDQKVDPKAMLGALRVTSEAMSPSDKWGSVKQRVNVRLLDAKEIAADKTLKSLSDSATAAEHTGRWIAFKPVAPLPKDATITISLPIGTPSAEGPNRTTEDQSFSFHTYPPLKLQRARCNWDDTCRPGNALAFEFNNGLDATAFTPQQVTVTPAIEDMHVVAQGDNVVVYGATKARTTYQVTVTGSLIDEFGQKLGTSVSHSFKVGDAEPSFFGPSGIVVLDPAATKRTLDFFSTNYDAIKVRVYKVTTADVPAFANFIENRWNKDHPVLPPGTKVFDQLVQTKAAPNELVETSVDLSAALAADGLGHAVVIAEPSPWKETWEPPTFISWVQSTKLAVDGHVDGDHMLAFVTELDGGKPAGDVTVELRPTGTTAKTDAQGLAEIPLGEPGPADRTSFVIARRGSDVAFLTPSDQIQSYGNWYRRVRGRALTWYVADDRHLYKPGEDVTLKGWLRLVDQGKNGDVGGPAGASKVRYYATDSNGNKLADGEATVNVAGGFDFSFKLPGTPSLGNARIEMFASGDSVFGQYYHSFEIEEFRRPEFEVSASAGAGPFLVGEGGDVTVAAKYYAGGALPGAEVNWSVSTSPTSFTPPNRDDYVFGNWQPWWGYSRWYDDDDVRPSGRRAADYQTFKAKTDGAGEHVLHMDFLSIKPSMPMTVSASATVMDVNRQAWTASTSVIVHPASLYAGIKVKRPYVEQGQPFDVDVIAVDLDGAAQAGTKVSLQSVRMDWEYKNGRYASKEVDPQTCAVVAKADAVPCSFQTPKGGTYQLVATVKDARGRTNTTKLTYWVSGGDAGPPSREVEREVVPLIPDRQTYVPGTTAELLLQAPFYPAEGVVTWRRSGIVKVERITLTGPTASLKVPITDAMTPNMYVHVDLVGMATRTDDHGMPDPKLPKRPAYAAGEINLPIPPRHRALTVTATPSAAKVSPGEEASIAVEIKDASGAPVANAEAAVIVVDESVLALAAYTHPDPLPMFYPSRDPDTADYYQRAYVKLARPERTQTAMLDDPPPPAEEAEESGGTGTAMALDEGKMGKKDSDRAEGQYKMKKAEAAPAAPAKAAAANAVDGFGFGRSGFGPGGGKKKPTTPITVRTNFNALASFAPAVKTDAAGRATVSIKMPDNLTRYRIVAIAVAGDKQFGKGESAITARLPLMVRPSAPRFLNFGDTFELPVVVQNQTDAPMTVQVAGRAANVAFTDGAGREVAVPANDRVEVRFPMKTDKAGRARFQFVAGAGTAADAANLDLPVWTPATTEAFATYGVIDDGAVSQPVALPGKVWPQFGGIDVTTASTNLQALTDAVIYLVRYPYECAEQRSSRIITIATLRDVLTAFKTPDLPSAAEMEASVTQDLERLTQMQNYDGGFTWWERGYPSDPYLTVFVTEALNKASASKLPFNLGMAATALNYMKNIDQHIPATYPEDVRTSIEAYSLYVRKLSGDVDIAEARRIYKNRGGADKIPMEALGWLLGVMAGNADAAKERAEILRFGMNHISETAGAANFTTGYRDGGHLLLASDRRVDAIWLESLIQEQPKNDVIPKLVTGLLAHRKRGHWLSTQENAFVLMALEYYFRVYEKVTPNFVARIWLGADYAGDHAFRGRTTEYYEANIAMADVATHDKQSVTIQKDGAGRLYYRIGMKYAPESLKLEPADYGFTVERRYEGIDSAKDVTRDQDGVWHVKAGARVRVTVMMVNENRRYHVALVDPMPAGFEAMNPALATTGPVPIDTRDEDRGGRYWWWWGPWYDHQNLRDERAEAFTSMLWEGTHKYQYVARATTPGNFVVPPAKAEEMYMPETFGRSASDRVIVE